MQIIFDKIDLNKLKGIAIKKSTHKSLNKLDLITQSYLKLLCKIKMKKLFILALRKKANITEVVNLYLNMCEEEMDPEKLNSKKNPEENLQNQPNNPQIHSNQKQFRSELTNVPSSFRESSKTNKSTIRENNFHKTKK